MPVVAVVLDGEQAIIGGLCIRQYIPGRGAVHKPLFQQEADKPALRHNQFLGGGTEIGAVLEVDKQVIKSALPSSMAFSSRSAAFFSRSVNRSEQSFIMASGEVATSHSFSLVM